ncbi:MAG: hypothetical protein HFJ45_04255 [Clostridia bacterium]|nr:hypothetical protein [Clostridia bacterium]
MDGDNNWYQSSDGYYEYSDIIKDGNTTNEITFTLDVPDENSIYFSEEDISVIIIAEIVKAEVDEDGYTYADWYGIEDDGA